MSEEKHTPGPWYVFHMNRTTEVQTADGTPVVQWMGFDGLDFNEATNFANARLISAAPETLEALKWAQSYFELVDMSPPDLCKSIDEAIAKAEGRDE